MNDISAIQRQPYQDVICHFVSGYAFGDCIGIAVQSLSGWWTVNEVKASSMGKVALLIRKDYSSLSRVYREFTFAYYDK